MMVSANNLRVKNESESLLFAICITFFLFVVIMGISIGTIAIPLIIAIIYVKAKQGSYLGNSIKVSSHQFPDIYFSSLVCAERLSMKPPDVFIRQDPSLQAYSMGIWGRKSVVLHSSLIEALNSSELASVIGHEFTHIKCEHTSWGILANLHSSIPIPIVSDILGLIFNSWGRKAEFTCDRGGLIACQDINASIGAMAKLAVGKQLFEKLDLELFKDQHIDVSNDEVAKLSELLQTHPHIVNRIKAMVQYFNSNDYLKYTVNSSDYNFANNVNIDDTEDSIDLIMFCTECGKDFPEDHLICMNCGSIRE